jgi:hypothetical protein
VGGSHRLKLRRATQHLNTLRHRTEVWVEREPVIVVGDCEVKTREHFVRLRVRSDLDPIFELLVGDCIHCLRQALDHLAYGLAISVSGSDPPPNEETTGFPITTSLQAFNSALPAKIGKRKRIPAGLYEALEQMQPYNGGDLNLEVLWVLHRLDNLDKHRFPPVVAGSVSNTDVDARHTDVRQITVLGAGEGGAVKDGEPIFHYAADENTEHHPDVQVTADIAFGPASPVVPNLRVIPVLEALRGYIWGEVLPALEPFL